MPSFRIVSNASTDETLLSTLSGSTTARFNGAAGVLFEQLHKGILTISDLQARYPDFYRSCDSIGLWAVDLSQWAFTAVDLEHQLKRIQIELTRFCNLSCSYCYSSCGPTKKSTLTLSDINGFLADAKALGCLWVDITGGEALAYPNWREVLSHSVSLGLVTSLHSNGTLLSQDVVSTLREIGISHLQVSLDSHHPAVHDRARGKAGAFDKSLAGVRRCLDAGIPVTISIVAHTGNRDHYVESVEFFQNEVGAKVLMDRVIRAGGELSSNVGLTTSEYYALIAPLVKKGIGESKVCDNYVVNDFKVEPFCGVAHSFVYITAEGEFALCPTMTSRDNVLFCGPTKVTSTLKTAWLSDPYFLRYRGLNCRNTGKCPTASKCGGGCRSNAYIDTGELDSPDFLSCNLHKNSSTTFVDFASLYSKSGKQVTDLPAGAV